MKTFPVRPTVVAASLAALCLPCSALDLSGAYRLARQADPAIRAADAALDAGREKRVQGDALLKPQVGLSAGLAYQAQHTRSELPAALAGLVDPDASGAAHDLSIQLKQPLYDARAGAEKAQLHQQAGLAETAHREAEQQLIGQVAETYLAALQADAALAVTRAEVAALTQQHERAQARFEVGRGKITEVQEALARLDAARAREVSAAATLQLRRAQFQALTGAPAAGLAPLAPHMRPQRPLPDDLAAWQARALADAPRVQRKVAELAIAEAQIGKYRLEGRPTLDLVASLGDQGRNGGLAASLSPSGSRVATIGVQLSVPLWAGGAIDSRLRESTAHRAQASLELDATRRDAGLQVQDRFLDLTTGVARIVALEQSLQSARTALDATTLGRDLGTRTDLDVLDAQQRVYAAELDLVQARHAHLNDHVRLKAAAGTLQVSDLQGLDAALVR